MSRRLLVFGLTGGIGMGKSTAARIMNRAGLPIHDADHVVHQLLGKNGKAVKLVARLFPESFKRKAIDRKILGALVFGKPSRLRQLESILHPLVHKAEREFIRAARRDGARAVVLEIPLLFETGADQRCDRVICVTASRATQKTRVMQRKGMTAARFQSILKHQLSDRDKRARSDYVVNTDSGYADTRNQLHRIMETLDLIQEADA